MPTKRLFIAIDISDDVRRRVAECIDELRRRTRNVRVGWEKPEKLHVTLKFLGDVDAVDFPSIQEMLTKVAGNHRPYTAEISGTGLFPSLRKPRVLWLALNDDGSTKQITGEIESDCQKLGFEADERQTNPHLTIARIREPQKGRNLAARHLENEFGPAQFVVTEIVIYESTLLPTGSVYNVLSSHPLGK